MPLKPWYKVVTPRADLREGKPLDAAEFAVHLEDVRDGRAADVYKNPEQFFERTYLTKNLTDLASQVIRRLNGEKTETSAVFNLATQFGGGKTHSLTLLYHLATHGPASLRWRGVDEILKHSGMATIPKARCAIFVGTEFDSLVGRGGKDGTPLRRTPWGEIAFQLSGAEGLAELAEHEKQLTAPAGDVIRRFLPKDMPCIILMDELMNYISRSRASGLSVQFYSFLQNLSEVAKGLSNVVLVASIPKSYDTEMTSDDEADYTRLKKMLDRLGKAIVMSAETEASEIIRRRLFEWKGLSDDAKKTIAAYADWVAEHKKLIGETAAKDKIRDAFAATYPFHPSVISVFERKWQALPRFQRTRGILRLLALWVSKAYAEGYKGAHRDLLITLGTAPLDDPMFRSAVFEQLGENKLEVSVTTDIIGKSGSHAVRLDEEAPDTIKEMRLHRKAATAIFFESNGGQAKEEATIPEIRYDVADPDLDIGNVETILEALAQSSYFLNVEKNRYRYGLAPNLNKLLADRKAGVAQPRIEERMRSEIQKAFPAVPGIERVFFPEKSSQIPDRPVITMVIVAPDRPRSDDETMKLIETMTREYGTSARTFKSALIWCVADSDDALRDETRKVLAWEDIRDEAEELRLDETQRRQLHENVKRAERDLRDAVWKTYKNLYWLGKENTLKLTDLGMIGSGSADSISQYIVNRLRQDDEILKEVSPTFLTRNWPPSFVEWSTKAVRDAFFASPQFPRLLNAEAVREAIARGVANGHLAYVGKKGASGKPEPFEFNKQISSTEIEISDDMYIITATEAAKYLEPPRLTRLEISPAYVTLQPGKRQAFSLKGFDQHGNGIKVENSTWKPTGGKLDEQNVYVAGNDEGNFTIAVTSGSVAATAQIVISKEEKPKPPAPPSPTGPAKLSWVGEVPSQKWMNFYTKVLSKFAGSRGLKLTVTVEVSPEGGVTSQQVEETKIALRELGLRDEVETK
jgi:hypothetical protein